MRALALQAPTAGEASAGRDGVEVLTSPRLRSRSTHGTGCVLSAACAALRPRRDGWSATVRDARQHLARAIAEGERLGVGRAARSGCKHPERASGTAPPCGPAVWR